MRLALAFTVGALLAMGTATAAPFGNGRVPLTIWQTDRQGAGRHVQSGAECPTPAADYRIQRVISFDQFGLDVGCNYRSRNGDVMTVHIMKRNGPDLQADFEKANREVVMAHPEMRRSDAVDGPALPQNSAWLVALYLDPVRHLRSGVWIADYSGWSFELQATYLESRAQQAFDAVIALTAAAEGARSHLAACANWTPPARTGSRIADERKTIPLTITGTAMAYAPLRGPRAPAVVDPIWCAEQGVSVEGSAHLFWHNVAEQDGGPVDRVTAVSDQNAAVIICVADTVGGRRADLNLSSVYDIVSDGKDQLTVLGIYEGRPMIEEIARFAARRYFGLFALIDKKTGKVNVFRSPP